MEGKQLAKTEYNTDLKHSMLSGEHRHTRFLRSVQDPWCCFVLFLKNNNSILVYLPFRRVVFSVTAYKQFNSPNDQCEENVHPAPPNLR